MGMWMHLGPLLASLVQVFISIPFLTLIVAIILFYSQKDKGEFVRANGKESLNFQITLSLVLVVLMILIAFIFGGALLTAFLGGELDSSSGGALGMVGSGLLIGTLFIVIGFGALILMVIGSKRAHEGEVYRYPLSWRLVK